LKEGKESSKKKQRLDDLRLRLGALQRELHDQGVPLAIVFEGPDPWAISDRINDIIRWLDPRGCDFNYMLRPTFEEKQTPFICRYFQKMPAKGRIGIFDRSWYFWSIYDHSKTKDEAKFSKRLDDIRMLERQHHDGGSIIIKFFLDTGNDRQKKKKDEERTCKEGFHIKGEESIDDLELAKEDWKNLIRSTDVSYAPWIIIEEKDREAMALKVMEGLFSDVERCRQELPKEDTSGRTINGGRAKSSALDAVDMDRHISLEKYKERLDKLQKELAELQCRMYRRERSSIVLFEGWDAAGKGGNILRLTASLNPRGYRVAPIVAPNDEERSHYYLWRFYNVLPRDGMITIFDRSWYGRVLVEKVEGFASPVQVERAYEEINDLERMLTGHGTVIIKFWLQIDEQEQLARFREREKDPEKRWKITEDDWRNRSKWEDYKDAVDEMIARTDSKKAPWTIVPSNDKRYSRIDVLESIVKRFEEEID